MFTHSSHLTRLALSAAAAVGVSLAVAGSGIAVGSSPNGSEAAAPSKALTASLVAAYAGSELQFVGVAPCRIIDTRVAGGVLVSASRTFTAVGPYAAQGGNPAGCNIPAYATAVELNVGAISYANAGGWVKGWATGTTEPNASLVNYDKSGPVANMVTVPVNASGSFTLKTNAKAHLFVDVAGYYVKPLYAAISSTGAVYTGISSGVVSSARTAAGSYTVTFDRDVSKCAAVASDIIFATTHDISVDNLFSADPDTVTVRVTDAGNTLTDTYFTLSLTC